MRARPTTPASSRLASARKSQRPPLDVLYFVRDGANEELRLSLRSVAANLPHERVWIVGDKPEWVKNVHFIQGNRRGSKWLNVFDNLRIACRKVDAERFVVMNDDFYITEPVTEIPPWHRGPLSKHIAMAGNGDWGKSLAATKRFLEERGFDDPLSYELHVPVVMERDKLGTVLREAMGVRPVPPQWRTLYGNWWHVRSEPAPDVKAHRHEFSPTTFLSTTDMTFHNSEPGRWLRARFPSPSPYERRR